MTTTPLTTLDAVKATAPDLVDGIADTTLTQDMNDAHIAVIGDGFPVRCRVFHLTKPLPSRLRRAVKTRTRRLTSADTRPFVMWTQTRQTLSLLERTHQKLNNTKNPSRNSAGIFILLHLHSVAVFELFGSTSLKPVSSPLKPPAK